MTITNYDGVAILPKRCDICNRLFWLEPYNTFYITFGIESYSLKQIKCKNCVEKDRKCGGIMKYWETDFNRDEQSVIDELRRKGYFVYGLRDAGGDRYTIEPNVIIDRIGFLVTDEPIYFPEGPTDWCHKYITDEELTEIGVADEEIRNVIIETKEKMK